MAAPTFAGTATVEAGSSSGAAGTCPCGPDMAVGVDTSTHFQSREIGMSKEESGFFDTRRAADYLGLSHRTLDSYRVTGAGPAFHRFGNRVRYLKSDLESWAAKRRATTTAEADRLKAA